MNFSSFSEFIAMGGHGAFVWSAYGITLLVLAVAIIEPLLRRQKFFDDQARQIRREESDAPGS